jgi:hypothetical protein
MSIFLAVGLLAAGGLATSYAEHRFAYNLYEYVVAGVKKALGFAAKAEADVKAVEKKL